ncbi:methionyl-tRNA formyltransferase [Patescibacteria group bacterium]|nr:methionyl-tRNA formyltransferase [Patescibacteria group bacterium]
MSEAKYRVGFMGTPEAAVPILQALINDARFEIKVVITQPDKPIGRSKTPKPSPVKLLALSANIPILTPEKVKNNSELIAQLKALGLDAIVVAIYGKILPQEVLDIPRRGIVVVHPSTLPKYRGASPVASAILNGDQTTGVTIMKMVLEMDAGPIIGFSDQIKIADGDTTATLSEKLAHVGADTLIKYLPDYLDGTITPIPQDDTQATYVKLINKHDGLIDWQEDSKLIERKIRAYQPWPGVFTKFDNKLLKILRAEFLPETGMVGSVYQTVDGYPAVFAEGGSLKLTQVQLEGKKPTSGADFIKGYPKLLNGLV